VAPESPVRVYAGNLRCTRGIACQRGSRLVKHIQPETMFDKRCKSTAMAVGGCG